ncbi:DUF6457 domain-containing protein [Cellulosimicrobium sp. Marseille-Q8652]
MTNLERWVDALVDEFDLDPDVVDMRAVLDLARDAAHGVERPAAPLTTFIAGYVAGMAAGEGADHPIEDVLARATELALAWTAAPELPVTADAPPTETPEA